MVLPHPFFTLYSIASSSNSYGGEALQQSNSLMALDYNFQLQLALNKPGDVCNSLVRGAERIGGKCKEAACERAARRGADPHVSSVDRCRHLAQVQIRAIRPQSHRAVVRRSLNRCAAAGRLPAYRAPASRQYQCARRPYLPVRPGLCR
jgi:hypothetical protein